MTTHHVTAKPPLPAELIRLSLGLRRRQIARMIGISFKTLERIERGLTWGKPETLRRIAEALGVDPEVYMVAVLRSWQQAKARNAA
jgi:transcriptional regulator with XRE-family HTH domain